MKRYEGRKAVRLMIYDDNIPNIDLILRTVALFLENTSMGSMKMIRRTKRRTRRAAAKVGSPDFMNKGICGQARFLLATASASWACILPPLCLRFPRFLPVFCCLSFPM